jgi:uncharacterized protein YjbJ (UPF0337 family)
MGKVKGKFEEMAGKAKQKYGDATDDESLQSEGIVEEKKGQARQAGEHVKDAAEDARRTVTE